MKRPRITIRLILVLIAAIAVPLAIDQMLETRIRTLSETLVSDPTSIIRDQPDIKGAEQIQANIDFSNLTTLADRLVFRRKLSVKFDEFRYLESHAGMSGLVLAKGRRNLLITPFSTSVD